MEKSLYYIECTCVKDCSFPNVDFHIGEVFYFNKNVRSNEMYLCYSNKYNRHLTEQEKDHLAVTFGKYTAYIPFTRRKNCAKKWQVKHYAEYEASIINNMVGYFNAVVKEIKVKYTEEEI